MIVQTFDPRNYATIQSPSAVGGSSGSMLKSSPFVVQYVDLTIAWDNELRQHVIVCNYSLLAEAGEERYQLEVWENGASALAFYGR